MLKEINFSFSMVGSRNAPQEHCIALEEAAVVLLKAGAIGLSGGAGGIDNSLTNAVRRLINEGYSGATLAKIFIPWSGFSDLRPGDLDGAVYLQEDEYKLKMAENISRVARRGFYGLNKGGVKLHSRNAFQVLDEDLIEPVNLMLLSAPETPSGVSGGTNTAYVVAKAFNIPTINLANPIGFLQLSSLLRGLESPTSGWRGRLRIERRNPSEVLFISETE